MEENLTLPSYTEIDKELAFLITWIYREPETRPKQLKVNNKIYNYNLEKSTDLWGLYEGEDRNIVGIHGASNMELTLLAINQVIDDTKMQPIIEEFCDFLDELEKETDKEIFLVAHSLGCWIISSCETIRGHSDNKGVMYAPYVPLSDKNDKSRFIIENDRYRKIYYDNDPAGYFLYLSKLKSNVLELKPRSDVRLFITNSNPSLKSKDIIINSHSASTFNREIQYLNMDVNKYYKPLSTAKKVVEETNLRIMSYNVQMLDKSIRNVSQLTRAKKIPKELSRRYGNIDIVIMEEVFDEDAEKILDKGMKEEGFIYISKKVGSPPNYKDKFDDGGVKIYSKHKINNSAFIVFSQSRTNDKIASKGVIRASIDFNGLPIDIYGTHLQTGSGKEKDSQFVELDNFITRKRISFLGGDFNSNRYNQAEYDRFNNLLNKDMKEFKYPDGEPSTIGTDFSTKKGEKKWVDYIFYFDNPKYEITGNVEIGSIRDDNGFKRPKNVKRTTDEIITGVGIKAIKEGVAGEIITKQVIRGGEELVKDVKKTEEKVVKDVKSVGKSVAKFLGF